MGRQSCCPLITRYVTIGLALSSVNSADLNAVSWLVVPSRPVFPIQTDSRMKPRVSILDLPDWSCSFRLFVPSIACIFLTLRPSGSFFSRDRGSFVIGVKVGHMSPNVPKCP